MTIRKYNNLRIELTEVLSPIAKNYKEVREMIRDFVGEFTYNSITLSEIERFIISLIDYLITKEAYEECASLKQIKDKL